MTPGNSSKPVLKPLNIRAAKQWGVSSLENSVLGLPHDVLNLEAEVLLLHSLQSEMKTSLERSWLYGHGEKEISDLVFNHYSSMIYERATGKPLAYITGRKEFFGYEFYVNQHTLIPRVESELLVETVLNILGEAPEALCVDVGTGSGCILLSILLEMKKKYGSDFNRIRWIGTDIQEEALRVASKNAELFKVSSEITFIQTSLLNAVDLKSFAGMNVPLVIVSNPPYIERSDPKVDPWVRKFEPETALYSPDGGFFHAKALIDNFLNICTYWKNEVCLCEAHLCIEIGFDQHNELLSFFNKNAPLGFSSEYFRDAAGIVRVLHFYNNNPPGK